MEAVPGRNLVQLYMVPYKLGNYMHNQTQARDSSCKFYQSLIVYISETRNFEFLHSTNMSLVKNPYLHLIVSRFEVGII